MSWGISGLRSWIIRLIHYFWVKVFLLFSSRAGDSVLHAVCDFADYRLFSCYPCMLKKGRVYEINKRNVYGLT